MYWLQENFFKYMREEFNLDSLPVHELASPDPGAAIVNPEWRRIDREHWKVNPRLGTIRNRMAAQTERVTPHGKGWTNCSRISMPSWPGLKPSGNSRRASPKGSGSVT